MIVTSKALKCGVDNHHDPKKTRDIQLWEDIERAAKGKEWYITSVTDTATDSHYITEVEISFRQDDKIEEFHEMMNKHKKPEYPSLIEC